MHPLSRLALSRHVLAILAALGVSFIAPAVAAAKVHITVDLDQQTIHVEANDRAYDWKISSGKEGFETPAGAFGVLWMDKDHHSDEYDQAPMPNAIFFAPGYAIHGAYKSEWGHPASHGCVRLPVAKSALLFDLVKAQGAEVTIVGYSPVTVASIHAKPKAESAVAADPDAYPPDDMKAYPAAPAYEPQRGGGEPLFGKMY